MIMNLYDMRRKKMNTYTTCQIAEYSGVCANTVRKYEKYGFISKPKRTDRGYRIFTDTHMMQMKICRLIFSPPYVNKVIRKSSLDVVYACGKEDFLLCKIKILHFINMIKSELTKADEAVKALEFFQYPIVTNGGIYYNRKEAAPMIGTTVETVKNWEQNGLIIAVK